MRSAPAPGHLPGDLFDGLGIHVQEGLIPDPGKNWRVNMGKFSQMAALFDDFFGSFFAVVLKPLESLVQVGENSKKLQDGGKFGQR